MFLLKRQSLLALLCAVILSFALISTSTAEGSASSEVGGVDLEGKDPHFIAAIDLFLAKDYEGAIIEFKEALKVEPNDEFAHNFLAHCLNETGKVDEAIKEYHEAIKINQYYAYAHNNLGVVLMKEKGDYDQAIEHFTMALRADPKHQLASMNLAAAKKEKAEKAEGSLK
ncbi:tetratricopeptide repeat protein [Thermodesulfobacteriota bacterium]